MRLNHLKIEACGADFILNEHIKESFHIFKNIYVKLFNIIFYKSCVPKCWTIGIINPTYKNKGEVTNPSNYRPNTLLSCLWKVYTAILNIRIQKFTFKHDIMNQYQAGFRKGYSTIDNILVLNTLIDLLRNSKKCFVLLLI